jgi:hypothetical protein
MYDVLFVMPQERSALYVSSIPEASRLSGNLLDWEDLSDMTTVSANAEEKVVTEYISRRSKWEKALPVVHLRSSSVVQR